MNRKTTKKYDAPVSHEVAIRDTMRYRKGYILLTGLNKNATLHSIPLSGSDVSVGAELEIFTHGRSYKAQPVYLIKNTSIFDFPAQVEAAGLKLHFSKILPAKGKVEITIFQQKESEKKFIVMKAIEFPYIIFLWTGTVIMIIGFLMSIFRRNKELSVG